MTGRSAVEVVPNQLYALGGTVALDERVSWVPAGTRGADPLLAYLLVEGERALLVDTGTGCNRALILHQLEELLSPRSELTIFITRAEFDSALNLPALVGQYPRARVLGSNRVFVNFLATQPPYRSDYRQRAQVVPPGTTIDFAPQRQIKVFDAPLRMLAAAWLHDPQTGVLFTSDSFGHVHLGHEDDPIIVGEAHDRTTLDEVRAHLLTKFDWMAEAETQETLAALQAVFEAVEVTGIAPGHGCVLMGDRVVARHLQLMADALCQPTSGAMGNGRTERGSYAVDSTVSMRRRAVPGGLLARGDQRPDGGPPGG